MRPDQLPDKLIDPVITKRSEALALEKKRCVLISQKANLGAKASEAVTEIRGLSGLRSPNRSRVIVLEQRADIRVGIFFIVGQIQVSNDDRSGDRASTTETAHDRDAIVKFGVAFKNTLGVPTSDETVLGNGIDDYPLYGRWTHEESTCGINGLLSPSLAARSTEQAETELDHVEATLSSMEESIEFIRAAAFTTALNALAPEPQVQK